MKIGKIFRQVELINNSFKALGLEEQKEISVNIAHTIKRFKTHKEFIQFICNEYFQDYIELILNVELTQDNTGFLSSFTGELHYKDSFTGKILTIDEISVVIL